MSIIHVLFDGYVFDDRVVQYGSMPFGQQNTLLRFPNVLYGEQFVQATVGGEEFLTLAAGQTALLTPSNVLVITREAQRVGFFGLPVPVESHTDEDAGLGDGSTWGKDTVPTNGFLAGGKLLCLTGGSGSSITGGNTEPDLGIVGELGGANDGFPHVIAAAVAHAQAQFEKFFGRLDSCRIVRYIGLADDLIIPDPPDPDIIVPKWKAETIAALASLESSYSAYNVRYFTYDGVDSNGDVIDNEAAIIADMNDEIEAFFS
jgi:hypothetical protein